MREFLPRNPDKEELRIRFGCGALLGLAIAIRAIGHLNFTGWFFAFLVAYLFGSLARKYGDVFWDFVLEWVRRLRWF